jgi:hypothetical protein
LRNFTEPHDEIDAHAEAEHDGQRGKSQSREDRDRVADYD